MKSAKQSVSCVAFLGLMLLMSGAANAEGYESLGAYNSSFPSSLSKAESVIRPAGAGFGSIGEGLTALKESLKASLEKNQKSLERNAKETELRKKIGGANELVASRQKKVLALDAEQDKKLKDLKDANAADLAGINAVTQAQGTNPNDANVSQLETSCRSGVDFTQAKSLTDLLGTEPFRYLRDVGSQVFGDNAKSIADAIKLNVEKLFANIEKNKGQKQNADAQQSILARQDITKGDISQEAGLKTLAAVWDVQKSTDLPESEARLTAALKEGITETLKLKENQNDPKFLSLKNFFADNAKGYLKQVRQAFTDGGKQLLANCDKNVDSLGRGNPLGASSWVNSAYQFAAKMNPTFANSTILPMLTQISQNATCTDVSTDIQNLLGGQLEATIEITRSSKDPKALIANAMAMLNAVGAAQAQIGTVLQPLMDDCQYAAKKLKDVKGYVGQLQNSGSDQQQPGQPNQPNRNRTNSSVVSSGRPAGQQHFFNPNATPRS